jgi:hypothetical protein
MRHVASEKIEYRVSRVEKKVLKEKVFVVLS